MLMTETALLEKQVLVVEDSSDLNRMFCKQLSGRGFTTTGVLSVAEANAYLREYEPPSLIVLDLELVDGSGTDVLELLNTPRYKNTKIVIVSGNAFGRKTKVASYKIDYALLKPVSPRALATLVSSLVL